MFMFAALMIGVQRAISLFTMAASGCCRAWLYSECCYQRRGASVRTAPTRTTEQTAPNYCAELSRTWRCYLARGRITRPTPSGTAMRAALPRLAARMVSPPKPNPVSRMRYRHRAAIAALPNRIEGCPKPLSMALRLTQHTLRSKKFYERRALQGDISDAPRAK